MSTGPGDASLPFHEGERAMHARVGVADTMRQRAAFIRGHMPDQHRAFFAQLPFVLVGGLDGEGQPWASVWTGPPGFMQSPDPERLDLRPAMLPGDPLAAHWHAGAPIGLLGIEPHTRRRNRMNGRVQATGEGGWQVAVQQSFGNCPKYIHARHTTHAPLGEDLAPPAPVALGPALDERSLAQIARADTLFIASSSSRADMASGAPGAGVDVSHRGGPAGFVHIERIEASEGSAGIDAIWRLTLPDYVGNMFFNTLGNILAQPRVGLLFMDVDQGDALWLACEAEVDFHAPDPARFPGAQRLVHMRVRRGWRTPGCLPLAAQPAPTPQS